MRSCHWISRRGCDLFERRKGVIVTRANATVNSARIWNSGLPGALAIASVLGCAAFDRTDYARAATTETVVVDKNTGLAIGGFDPVAYFIDQKARAGNGEFEHAFAGVVWRFANEGNRAAFADHPFVYAPRFGGHDPVGLARGNGVPGDPGYWLVSKDRLYLFFSRETRDAFLEDPDGVGMLADKNWPSVRLTLVP
jgi:YHS domain-containing protein